MARQPRLVLAGQPHLVRQRGHNGVAVVCDDADCKSWVALLRDAAVTHQVALQAWALDDDQFRLLLTPPSAQALSRMMQTLGRRYVGWFNARHGRTGTLWDGRYQACAVEPGEYELTAMRLVEAEDVAASRPGMTPPRTRLSSAGHHLGSAVDSSLTTARSYWALGNTPFEREVAWRKLLERPIPEATRRTVESSLRSGRPFASAHFIGAIQDQADWLLTPRPRGRPRKVS
jgi:putative transposase